MRYLIISLALCLSGCLATTPPKIPDFPKVPEELLKACPDLKEVDPTTTKLSDIIDVVADNYKEYYDCKSNVDDWITWYNSQRKLWESYK
jgi:hypothetical protein